MSEGPLRVVVADDHYLVREGVRQLLDLEDDLTVVGGAATADELIGLVGSLAPDAVVTDIRMPPDHRTEGIEAAHAIRSRWPEVGVVVLSAHADPAYAVELFSRGTAGLAYLLKDRVGDRAELTRAVRETAAGGSVVDGVVVEALVGRGRHRSALDTLTAREREVLQQMARGASNQAVATALHLSLSAVEKHITSILLKLGLSEETGTHRRVAAVLAYLAVDPR